MLDLISAKKDFEDGARANRLLNRAGIHPMRVRAAMWWRNRRPFFASQPSSTETQRLQRDGVVAVPNFLDQDCFTALYNECRARANQVRASHPPEVREIEGFGAKRPHAWGFDRFDGGTLNRFIDLNHQTKHAQAFARDARLSTLSCALLGLPFDPQKVQLYETFHGDEGIAHDLQKDIHRDTFFSSLKFWYFLEDVHLEDGPFHYAPGTHRPTRDRLRLEKVKAMAELDKPKGKRDGSFRVTPKELDAFGLQTPTAITVKANTLVMADTFGFHARGAAKPGAYRFALYGWLRVNPFKIFRKIPWEYTPPKNDPMRSGA